MKTSISKKATRAGRFFCSLFMLACGSLAGLAAQENAPVYRTEFVSYGARELAEKKELAGNQYYVPLKLAEERAGVYGSRVEIPYMWLDRDIFIRVEGMPSFRIDVNGRQAGHGGDSRTPAEFDISRYVGDGDNAITISAADGTGKLFEPAVADMPRAYIFSQPKLHIEDYIVSAPLDSTGRFANFEIRAVVANSYNFEEKVTIGFDLYTPEGVLKEYSIAEVAVPGRGRDTVVFKHEIYGAKERLWSAETPKMYYGMLSVRREGRMIEYVPYRVGFGETGLRDGKLSRNGKPIDIKAVRYNAAGSEKATSAQLVALKKRGYNTVCPDYPQPAWFYGLCEDTGLYVFDRANINPTHEVGNMRLGGTYSNAPELLDAYIGRMEAMYRRGRNVTCIVGWSVGGNAGNGYNIYKSYQWLKAADPARAVIYTDAGGQWNSDMEFEIGDR